MFNFIIEGGNATGKSTLLERLVSELPQYKTLYSSDSSFEPIRSISVQLEDAGFNI